MRRQTRLALAMAVGLGAAACQDARELPTATDPALSRSGEKSSELFSQFTGFGPDAGLRLVAEGLTSPITLREAPDRTGRLFIVDQVGVIRVVLRDGTLLSEPFLDVRDRMVTLNPGFDERGLLGLAFHPRFAENGRFFVYYSAPLRAGAPAGFNHTARISEFTAAPLANTADPGSERVVLEVDEPQSNHNGGTVEFGPRDGYLYISLGDGGGANDTPLGHVEDWYEVNAGGNGQDVEQNLLGSILRIDVDRGVPYTIPADNPFVGRDGLDEIYAYGLRNPYRMSFDMAWPHTLLAGDAGQRLAEEVSVIVKGGNYGWNVREGMYCFNAANNLQPLEDCPNRVGDGHPDEGARLLPPVIAYPNRANPFEAGLGVTVIGGHVYRGRQLPQFRGRYIFADFAQRVFIARPGGGRHGRGHGGGGLWSFQEIRFPRQPDGNVGISVKGFGQDRRGEVYVLGSNVTGPAGTTGRVYQLTRAGGHRER
ncbi:MAG TPA: PQQ-dependent sugar dehydrogenase [Longimicrobiaceae bacterium]